MTSKKDVGWHGCGLSEGTILACACRN